jgi:hypothetical protein
MFWKKKEKKGMMSVTSEDGRTFSVDISDKACSPFGFKHNDRAQIRICITLFPITIIGVAHEYEWHKTDKGRLVLWFTYDGYDGRVTHDTLPSHPITLRS